MDSFVIILIAGIVCIYLGLVLMVYAAQFLKPYDDEHNEIPTITDFPECEQAED